MSRGSWALVAAIAGCGGGPTPTPAVPPPAASTPLPTSRPVVTTEVRYEGGLTLVIRRNGQPVSGAVVLLANAPEPPEAFDGVAPPKGAIETIATAGVARIDRAQLAPLLAVKTAHVIVDGRRYPLAVGSGTSIFQCAETVAALDAIRPCDQPLPTAEVAPTPCALDGAAAWRALRSQKDAAADACWKAIDAPTIAALSAVSDPTVRHRGCGRLFALAGPDPADDVSVRLFGPCEAHLPAALAQRVTRAKRTRDLPGAYEHARTGTSPQMRDFFETYRVTEDPRVEEIRKLAQKRFGPPNAATFVALRAALTAESSGTNIAHLCDLRDGTATVAFPFCGGHGLSALRIGRGCGAPGPGMRSAPTGPDPEFIERMMKLVQKRTGGRVVQTEQCGVDHWYLPPEPPRR